MKPAKFNSELPLILYMEGALDNDSGKMGFGLMRFSANPIAAVIDSKFAGSSVRNAVGLPFDFPVVKDLDEAMVMGGKVMVLGIAPSGGRFPKEWDDPVVMALKNGLGIINGLHDRLNQRFSNYINDQNWIWDVRVPKDHYPIASAKAAKLKNRRILMVGTDMAAGKMTTGLELYGALLKMGKSVGFVATGQIGITITGSGIPLDGIKVDQAAGAVEEAVLSYADKDYIIIEGQGSLAHPGSTATLPLMRGSQPTDMILCHKAIHSHLRPPVDHVRIPPFKEFVQLNEEVCRVCGVLGTAKMRGIALNTIGLDNEEAEQKMAAIASETQLPTTDVLRYGSEALVNAILYT